MSDPSIAYVLALAVSGTNLFVGGYFTTAGGNPATNVAVWDGPSWSALGIGLANSSIGDVQALAVSDGNLYVAGTVPEAGVSSAAIAKWNGNNWTALGSGLNGLPDSLAVLGGALYVGGDFTIAGGKVSAYVRVWNTASGFLRRP